MTLISSARASIPALLAVIAGVVLDLVPSRLHGSARIAVLVGGWVVGFGALLAAGYLIGRALARGGRA